MSAFGKKTPPPPLPWHPDFRDATVLPDVKPVRTSFFINVFAVTLAVAGVLALGYVEMRRSQLRDDIRSIEAQVAEQSSRNQEILGLHRDYLSERRFIEEILKFHEAPVDASLFLKALGETLPEGIMTSNIRYSDYSEAGRVAGKQFVINGSVVGSPDEASARVTEYLNTFEEHPLLSRNLDRVQLTSLAATEAGNLMAFGIQLVYKPEDNQ